MDAIKFSANGTKYSCSPCGSGTAILLYTWSYRNLKGEEMALLTAPSAEVSVTRLNLNDKTCRRFMNCSTEIPVSLPPELTDTKAAYYSVSQCMYGRVHLCTGEQLIVQGDELVSHSAGIQLCHARFEDPVRNHSTLRKIKK